MSGRKRLAATAIYVIAAIGAVHESRAAHRPSKPPRSSASPAPISGNSDSKVKAASEAGIPLSLTDAVSLALRDNRTIRGATIDRIAQKFSLRVAEDGLMPHLGVSGGAVRQTIAGITTTSLDVSPGVTALLPTGATVTFSWADHASEGAGIRTRSTGSVLSINQPLLRGGGVDVTLAPIRSARLGEQGNRLRLKATVSETIGQVIYAYRDLLRAQKAIVLAQAAVRRAEEILDINRALIEAGRMAAVEIVQSEADLENQRLGVLGATRSLDSARLKLLDLLALDLGTPILATESTEPAQVATQLPHLMAVAFAQRPDYLGQLLALEQTKLGLVVAENARLWDLSLFATRSVGRTTITGPQGSVTGQSDTTVGLSFNAPSTISSASSPSSRRRRAARPPSCSLRRSAGGSSFRSAARQATSRSAGASSKAPAAPAIWRRGPSKSSGRSSRPGARPTIRSAPWRPTSARRTSSFWTA